MYILGYTVSITIKDQAVKGANRPTCDDRVVYNKWRVSPIKIIANIQTPATFLPLSLCLWFQRYRWYAHDVKGYSTTTWNASRKLYSYSHNRYLSRFATVLLIRTDPAYVVVHYCIHEGSNVPSSIYIYMCVFSLRPREVSRIIIIRPFLQAALQLTVLILLLLLLLLYTITMLISLRDYCIVYVPISNNIMYCSCYKRVRCYE